MYSKKRIVTIRNMKYEMMKTAIRIHGRMLTLEDFVVTNPSFQIQFNAEKQQFEFVKD